MEENRTNLDREGFLVIEGVLEDVELTPYRALYDGITEGKVKVDRHRHDLGSHLPVPEGIKENICQVMWPSVYLAGGRDDSILHKRTEALAQQLLGPDMVFDFDMLISKDGGSLAETPWHQDESYWPDLPDKRALSFWFPMEDATVDNGCMWFVHGSHQRGLLPHQPVRPGHHVMQTKEEVTSNDGQACPVASGGCTVHTGRTLHYTGVNRTERARRAYIINCRPKAMVELERAKKFDHGLAGVGDILQEHSK